VALSRVQLFELIRRDRRLDPQVPVRELMRRYRVSHRTVTQALESALPPTRRPAARSRASVLAVAAGWIDEMLRADLDAPRKQRHTARRVFERLREEYDFAEASYRTVCAHVARRRREIVAEAREGSTVARGMVPQTHEPGAEAEVDFAEVFVEVAGEQVKCHLFTLRMSYSGKAVHRVFASQSQEAFMEGHIEAFRVLGGVPTRHIRYDNLRPAVNRVCFGRSRVESSRWVAFRSHYEFDPFYCLPGRDGAHEKGGVEHEGGRFRRTHLVPVLSVTSLTELNEHLARIDTQEDARHVHGAPGSVGFNFAAEAPLLRPLPAEDFEPGLTLTPTVRRDGRVVVRQGYYSVPARFIGTRVRVLLRANQVLVTDRGRVVASHRRLSRRWDYSDDLDHYLEILAAKPGALAGSTALAQARAAGRFTCEHEAFWAAARTARGEAAGTRALIEVLLLHRRMPFEAVGAGLAACLHAGSTSPDLVAIEARRHLARTTTTAAGEAGGPRPPALDDGDGDTGPQAPPEASPEADSARPADTCPAVRGGQTGPAAGSPRGEVVDLRTRAPLMPADTRPPPSVAAYDHLLPRLRGTR
jgi:transposase